MGLTHCSLSHLESQRTMQNLKEQCRTNNVELDSLNYESLGLISLSHLLFMSHLDMSYLDMSHLELDGAL